MTHLVRVWLRATDRSGWHLRKGRASCVPRFWSPRDERSFTSLTGDAVCDTLYSIMPIPYEYLSAACRDYQPGTSIGRSIRADVKYRTDGVFFPPTYLDSKNNPTYAQERRNDGSISIQLDSVP